MKNSIQTTTLRRTVALVSTCALLGSACELLPERPEPPVPEHLEPNPDALQAMGDCDNLLSNIQEQYLGRMMLRAEQMRSGLDNYNGQMGEVFPGDEMLEPTPNDSGPRNPVVIDSAPEPTTGSSGTVTEGNNTQSASAPSQMGGSGGSAFSGTTTQVADVDEADIVKAEGDAIFLLQGDVLFKAKAWPAEDLEVVGAAVLEGRPFEMLVHEGRAMVFSRVYRDLKRESGPQQPNPDYYYYGRDNYTKLTLLDVTGDEPEVIRESYVQGDYVSSRRHGDVMRTVVTDYYGTPNLEDFYLEYITPFGDLYRQQDIDAQVDAWVERTSWVISESTLGDWLPTHFEVRGGVAQEQPFQCEQYFQATDTSDERNSGVTQVASLAMGASTDSDVSITSFVGNTSRIYSNENVLLLANTDYGNRDTDYVESTVLHRFDIDGLDTQYVASGRVPGRVHNQFSLDEYQGAIRLSTTESRWFSSGAQPEGPINHVFTLATNGDWLDILGQTEDFGLNEEIYATRFIGNRGYVVTFRQTDPLFVIDLEQPAEPEIVGELHIPGFSNTLYPLGEDHLLSVGRDATEEGRVQGVALQIFDVSDATNPSLTDRYVYEQADGSTSIEVDHRGISFDPNSDRIAFPLNSYNYPGDGSSLEIFRVDPSTGIERLGAVVPDTVELDREQCFQLFGITEEELQQEFEGEDAERFVQSILNECRYYFQRETMQRGVFREDIVFGISSEAIYAQQLDDLSAPPLAMAPLPTDRNGYGGGMMVGFPGGGAAGSMMPIPTMGQAGGGAMATPGAGGAAGSGMQASSAAFEEEL